MFSEMHSLLIQHIPFSILTWTGTKWLGAIPGDGSPFENGSGT